MTPGSLFRRRVKEELRFQLAVVRSVIDWTVAVYIVVPLLAIGLYQYAQIWRTFPAWASLIPPSAVFTLFFLLARAGTIRTFLAEADQLFLLQHPSWPAALKRRGTAYSFTLHLFPVVLLTFVALPIMAKGLGWSWSVIAGYALFAYLAKMNYAYLKLLIAACSYGWRRWGVQWAAFFCFGFGFVAFSRMLVCAGIGAELAADALLLALVVVQVRHRLRRKGTFSQDVQRESDERYKWLGFILGFAKIVEQKSSVRMKKPLLFPNSGKLYRKRSAVNVLAEFALKSLFRSGSRVKSYVQFTVFCFVIVLLLPVWMKWLFWIATPFLFGLWMKSVWLEVSESAFLKLFAWRDATLREAGKKAMLAMTAPGYLAVTLVAGAALHSLLAWLVLLIGLPLMAYASSRVIGSF